MASKYGEFGTNAARADGHQLITNTQATQGRGSIRTAHIRTSWNTTLCGKTLSTTSTVNPSGYIHGHKLCAACDRKA